MTGPAPTPTEAAARTDEPVTGLINRIDWEPGSDVLRGTCHCGARHTCDDPVAMWIWLLAHPEGHEGGTSDD
jgi:hypothetical protein